MKTQIATLPILNDSKHQNATIPQVDNIYAFNELILQYQDAAYNFACYLLGDADAADDVTQQAFINAYMHLSSFKGTLFRGWLFKIIKNACIDELRRQKRKQTFSLENMEDDNHEPAWNRLSAIPLSPEQVVEQTESAKQIQDTLNQMDEAFRIVLVLVDVQEFDYQETAQIIGVPLGTVKSRLARARHQFRALLER